MTQDIHGTVMRPYQRITWAIYQRITYVHTALFLARHASRSECCEIKTKPAIRTDTMCTNATWRRAAQLRNSTHAAILWTGHRLFLLSQGTTAADVGERPCFYRCNLQHTLGRSLGRSLAHAQPVGTTWGTALGTAWGAASGAAWGAAWGADA